MLLSVNTAAVHATANLPDADEGVLSGAPVVHAAYASLTTELSRWMKLELVEELLVAVDDVLVDGVEELLEAVVEELAAGVDGTSSCKVVVKYIGVDETVVVHSVTVTARVS